MKEFNYEQELAELKEEVQDLLDEIEDLEEEINVKKEQKSRAEALSMLAIFAPKQ